MRDERAFYDSADEQGPEPAPEPAPEPEPEPETGQDASKPRTYNGDLGNLPAELEPLTSLIAWMLWRWEKKKGKWTKPPLRPDGHYASSTDPSTWSSYEVVVAAYQTALGTPQAFDGIGLVLPPGIVALDVDNCMRDGDYDTVDLWCANLVSTCNSYAEITPSGTGFRIIGRSSGEKLPREKMPTPDGNASVEIYQQAIRYITITGNTLPNSVNYLKDLTDIIPAIYKELDRTHPKGKMKSKSKGGGKRRPRGGQARLTAILEAGVGPGERYPSKSEQLCGYIAELVRQDEADAAIVEAILTLPPDHAISQHIAEQKKEARVYVERQVRQIREKVEAEEVKALTDAEARVAAINEEYALVLAGDKHAVMKFEDKSFRLLKPAAFVAWFKNHPPVKIIDKYVPVADYWLAHPRRRSYEGIEFEPRGGRRGYYNLFRGFAVEPKRGSCIKFLAHIRKNVAKGDKATYRWIMGWLAAIFQQPTVKMETAVVLRGGQGVGKTKVGEVIGSLLGDHYILVSSSRYVTGQFNSHMKSLLLLHADEAFWAGDKAAEGKLRDLVSGGEHLIEYKGIDQIRVTNLIRLLVTGNDAWQVPAAFGERRFAVFDVGDAHKEDHAYFAAIDKEMDNGGREALLYYLLNFPLASVNLRKIPETAALLEQKIASMSPEQSWWFEMLRKGELPARLEEKKNEEEKNKADENKADENEADENEAEEKLSSCLKRYIFDGYIAHADRLGVRRKVIETQIGLFLTKHVPDLISSRQTIGTGKQATREWVYTFPTLTECRRAFAQAMQHQDIDWGEEWEGEVWERTDLPF